MDIQLGDSNQFDSVARTNYDRIFTLMMTGGFLSIPVVGLMMDHIGFPVTSFMTSLFGLLWSLCLFSGSASALLLSFVFYALFRTFLYTFLFAYAADVMGFKYFGVLVGIIFVIGGFASLLQYPIARWATGTCHNATEVEFYCDTGNWSIINLVLVFTMILSFIFSHEDWVRRRSIMKKIASRVSIELYTNSAKERLFQTSRTASKDYGTL